jgi:hypothetical protein
MSCLALPLLFIAPQGVHAPEPAAPVAAAAANQGHVFLTRDEALALAFKDCKIERQSFILDEEQKLEVEKLAKCKLESGVVFAYVATRDGKPVGTAWFDTHRVRSLRETLMVVVGPRGEVQRTELLAFAEPREYIPRDAWYALFIGRPLDDELEIKRAIRGVAGATLTARATTQAVRRSLALQAVLFPERPPTPPPE